MTDNLAAALARAVGTRLPGPHTKPVAPETGALADMPPALNSTDLEDSIARAVGAPTKEN